jgi:thiol:disulfide interchange protein DsbD
MLLWAVLLISYGTYLAFLSRGATVAKVFGTLFGLLGIVQLIGVATGGRDVFAPLAHLRGEVQHVKFQRVHNTQELDAILARSSGKLVMLDFYADWCVSCKEMEKLTFVAPKVKAKLDTMLLLQVDVTANNADDKVMLKRFGLFGPPGIIFFDYQGRELTSGRVIGYQNEAKFLQSLLSLTP